MLMVEGKYGTAKVMIDTVDATTMAQITKVMSHPATEGTNVVIMPDCHAGAGCVVGFTQTLGMKIVPNLIGVDIGCGVDAVCLGNISVDCAALDRFAVSEIPSGFSRSPSKVRKFTDVQKRDDDFGYVVSLLGLDKDDVLHQIGSLGGGNHFLELGVDGHGYKWLFVHSGSRNFGKMAADYYQARAAEKSPHGVERGTEWLDYGDADYFGYLRALRVCTKFAALNRSAILDRVLGFLGVTPAESISSVHNYIGDDRIVRKGAISARAGDICIIPFNMRDGVAICAGNGSSEWNYSAPHGAGRVLSRSQAKKALVADDIVRDMASAGVYTTTAAGAVDEAPAAYKDAELIKECIRPTVDVLHLVKPIWNFKAPDAKKERHKGND